jgi:3-deoxy-D-manno-octulosonic acid kinase
MSGRWPLGSEVKRGTLAGGAMLYDGSRANNFAPAWFDASYWKSRGEIEGSASGGRGTTHFFKTGGKSLVLRHYRRGGLIAHVSGDKYFWRGEDNTRPFSSPIASIVPVCRCRHPSPRVTCTTDSRTRET